MCEGIRRSRIVKNLRGGASVNRRAFLRAVLGFVAAPIVAKVAPGRPPPFGFPVAESIVLGSFDYYGPQRAALMMTRGEDGVFVATAGEWEPIPEPLGLPREAGSLTVAQAIEAYAACRRGKI